MRRALADQWGVPIQSESPAAVSLFDAAVEGLVSLTGDPLSAAEDAVDLDDRLILGHILRAYLFLYSTSERGVTRASRILEQFDGADQELDEREVLHLRAARAWASGEWVEATRSLERALLHEPRDLLALKIAQDLYFFLGETADLHGVVARVLSAWRPEYTGWGYVQGMYAFGLEENEKYREAEEFARRALEANPHDVWAVHALAHVFEMQGRTADGIPFLIRSSASWDASYFAVHNWWHLALYHLERGAVEEVIALYDGPIRGGRSIEWLHVVDAASLLWRLSLAGVDVSQRARELTSDIEPLLGRSVSLFNDWHAIMTFGLAGRSDLAERVITASHQSVGTNGLVGERVGFALLEAFSSFAMGKYLSSACVLAECVPLGRAVGGSNAQRDIIDQTLITAVVLSGQSEYARALVAERLECKPAASRSAERLLLAKATSEVR
jgi:tetratricopeptide (TPR) repeat protein